MRGPVIFLIRIRSSALLYSTLLYYSGIHSVASDYHEVYDRNGRGKEKRRVGISEAV